MDFKCCIISDFMLLRVYLTEEFVELIANKVQFYQPHPSIFSHVYKMIMSKSLYMTVVYKCIAA